jgi:GNAT superfamily N-acetyltransferase
MIHLRKAEVGDIPALLELWREMWLYHKEFDPRYELTDSALIAMKYWLDVHVNSDRSIVLVAEDESVQVGYILGTIVENPLMIPAQYSGYISELAVTSIHRRKGVGNLLLEESHKWFRQNNIGFVDVNASVFNKASRNFWRKHGYKEFLERLRVEL